MDYPNGIAAASLEPTRRILLSSGASKAPDCDHGEHLIAIRGVLIPLALCLLALLQPGCTKLKGATLVDALQSGTTDTVVLIEQLDLNTYEGEIRDKKVRAAKVLRRITDTSATTAFARAIAGAKKPRMSYKHAGGAGDCVLGYRPDRAYGIFSSA